MKRKQLATNRNGFMWIMIFIKMEVFNASRNKSKIEKQQQKQTLKALL